MLEQMPDQVPDQMLNQKAQSPYKIQTFGCKVNTYDTGLIYKNLMQNPWIPKESVHVLNTCAVTSEATQQAVREIRKIKAKDPFSTIIVTGCAAQVDTGVFEKLPSVDLIVANSHKGMLAQIIEDYFKKKTTQKTFKSNIFKKEELDADGGLEPNHSRSFLKIQDGCNSFCTFCIIPFARGKSRSIPTAKLISSINTIHASGVQEVVLTGVHIGDYFDDTKVSQNSLEFMLEDILKMTTIPRIRLSSLEPIEISSHLLELFSNKRLCPHFHMSIQSADTEVLLHMKRKYTAEQIGKSLEIIRKKLPEAFIGMDVIAGFPTESDENFENTYRNLALFPWTKLHVFPYSERSGTRASGFTQVDFSIRKKRAQKLRELSQMRFQSEALKQNGKILEALVLKKPSRNTFALSQNYWPISLEGSNFEGFEKRIQDMCQNYAGMLIKIKITGFDSDIGEGALIGEMIP